MSDFFKNQKAPHDRLREDIFAVQAKFAEPNFKGEFDMGAWGEHDTNDHDPAQENFCGTSACLAGWLSLVSQNGYRSQWRGTYLVADNASECFHEQAWKIYGMTGEETDRLFANGLDRPLDEKLDQALTIADAIEARSKKKTSSHLLPPSTSNPEGK